MPFAQIKGQEKAITALRHAMANHRQAHGYLFIGPEGVGKRLTAMTLAKAMNCQSPPEPGDCCEKCPPCIKANSSNHPDIILVEPEGEFIKIDQVREMQKRLRFRPMEGGRRACMIDPADRMKAEASNALLKILEEPPQDTHLFLITGKPHQLLSTILSRCQWIRFKPLSQPDIARILEKDRGLEEEKAYFYASLAGGSVGQAVALSERVDFQKRLEWIQFFSHLPRKSEEEVFESCERLSKEEEDIGDLLDLWKTWVRDLTVFKMRGNRATEGLINHDLLPVLEKDAARASFERLEGMFSLISEVQRSLDYNVNKQLALETLMLEIRKEGSLGGR